MNNIKSYGEVLLNTEERRTGTNLFSVQTLNERGLRCKEVILRG